MNQVTAPEKIRRGGKTETLSYINDDEARLLTSMGASGERTPYGGGIPSYGLFSDLGSAADYVSESISEASSGLSAAGDWISSTFGSGETGREAAIRRSGQRKKLKKKPGESQEEFHNRVPAGRRVTPENRTEYKENPAGKVDLEQLYSHRDDTGAMTTYLDTFKEREEKPDSTNETGGTTTYKYKAVETGVPADFASQSNEDRWFPDAKGNIIGFKQEDGMPGFENQNQWQLDENDDAWVFVGEGSTGGGGGEGTAKALNPDTGAAQIVGSRTYAQMLGYDKDKLKVAEEDRGKQVGQLKAMADRYGGKYDDETGEFLGGGLEEKFLQESGAYDKEIARMYGLDVQVKKTNPDGSPVLGADGQPVMETQKGDTFWQDMEDEAGQLPTDMQAKLYGKRADELVASETEQTADLQRMMAERGIDPTSPQAMRMRQQVKSGTRTSQRQARRESLGDAMVVKQQQEKSKLMARTGRLAGMEGQSAQKFSQGAHYGAKSTEIRGSVMQEAVDRQRSQESKKAGGLQMRIAKLRGDKEDEMAEKIAAMKSSGSGQSGGGGGGGGGKGGGLTGALAGGVSGFAATGSPWGAAAGAVSGFFSDRDLKKKVRTAKPKATREDVGKLLNSLKAYNFEYKNSKYGEGRRMGIMAQDLEKTELGKRAVVNTPEGKMIDMGKGLGIALAAQAHLNKQTKYKRA